jgi:hypothetical protein
MSPNVSFSGGSGRKGGNKKEQVLAAMLIEPTRKAAAESVGISPRTLARWLKEDSAFAEAYQAAKAELVESMTTRLRTNGIDAVATLAEVAKGSTSPNQAARVSAARTIIELVLKAHEAEDLGVRLQKLESERNSDENS